MGKSSPSLRVSASLAQILLSLRRSVGKLRIVRRSRLAQQIELVEASGFFDRHWYLRTYPDVKRAGIDPLVHFLEDGWGEGRDPGPDFVTAAYLEANADVARLGINPLLHFLEFGQSEGRATFGHRPLPNDRPAAVFDFAPPFPVAIYPVAQEQAIDWLTSADLDPERSDVVEAGTARLGYAPDPTVRAALDDALQFHQALSGHGEVPAQQSSSTAAEWIKDAWYPNSGGLRARLASDRFPFVVRALQYDPSSGASIVVGEGLLAAPLDLLDLELANPYFPLIFVTCDPDGSIRGALQLAFPSLCRGGLHHPELLGASGGCFHNTLAAALIKLLGPGAEPAIGSIAVDLGGADGSGPLFQRDFQAWLQQVLRIGVAPYEASGASEANCYLADAVTVSTPRPGRDGGATLVVGGDMIPTISALTASADQGLKEQESFAPVIISSSSKPSGTLIELPESWTGLLKQIAPHSLTRWPRLSPSAEASRPAAIRTLDGNAPTEAELFYPTIDATPAQQSEGRAAISWLIEVANWGPGQLDHALHALAMQEGGGSDFLCLVGRAPAATASVAEMFFPGRVTVHRSSAEAAEAVSTPLAGHLGAGVLLHDNSTSRILAALLQCEGVATVSCVAISSERRGKRWSSTLCDGGILGKGAEGRTTIEGWSVSAEQLWGTCYPVASPSDHLWLAEASRVASWAKSRSVGDDPGGAHVYSAATSVSYLGGGGVASRFVPTAPNDRVTSVRSPQ